MPDNISLPHLPPYGPELNPIETVRGSLRGNTLGNSVFDDDTTTVDRRCTAWNWLRQTPDRVRSIATRSRTETVTA